MYGRKARLGYTAQKSGWQHALRGRAHGLWLKCACCLAAFAAALPLPPYRLPQLELSRSVPPVTVSKTSVSSTESGEV